MYRYELNKQFEKYYNSGYDPDLIPNDRVRDKRYVSLLTSMSHTYGNIFAFIQNWLINLFPKYLSYKIYLVFFFLILNFFVYIPGILFLKYF